MWLVLVDNTADEIAAAGEDWNDLTKVMKARGNFFQTEAGAREAADRWCDNQNKRCFLFEIVQRAAVSRAVIWTEDGQPKESS